MKQSKLETFSSIIAILCVRYRHSSVLVELFFSTASSHRLCSNPDRITRLSTTCSLQCRFSRMSTRLHRPSSSTVNGSTSLLMMRTQSVVRCRGIYRLRDTSVVERTTGGGAGV